MKNNYLFLLGLVITIISCSDSDDECLALVDGELKEVVLDQEPIPINNEDGWVWSVLTDTLRYPAEARENGIEGTVEVQYAVSETGAFQEISLEKDIGGGCGDVCIELLSTIEGEILFHPGIYRDEPVKVYKILPITFKLE